MEKDRATQYWDNEIKRAAENTAKALAEYNQAKKERLEPATDSTQKITTQTRKQGKKRAKSTDRSRSSARKSGKLI